MKNIHCFKCKGSKTIYKPGIGKVTCLDCRGLGFVAISDEYFEELEQERIQEENRQFEEKKKKDDETLLRMKREIAEMKKNEIEYDKKRKSNIKNNIKGALFFLLISVTLLGIGILYNSKSKYPKIDNFIIKGFCYFGAFVFLVHAYCIYEERDNYSEKL